MYMAHKINPIVLLWLFFFTFAKNKNGFNKRVLRRYFLQNDLLHHRTIKNATGAAQRANNGIFGRDNTCGC